MPPPPSIAPALSSQCGCREIEGCMGEGRENRKGNLEKNQKKRMR
jgi:hypothetical protein